MAADDLIGKLSMVSNALNTVGNLSGGKIPTQGISTMLQSAQSLLAQSQNRPEIQNISSMGAAQVPQQQVMQATTDLSQLTDGLQGIITRIETSNTYLKSIAEKMGTTDSTGTAVKEANKFFASIMKSNVGRLVVDTMSTNLIKNYSKMMLTLSPALQKQIITTNQLIMYKSLGQLPFFKSFFKNMDFAFSTILHSAVPFDENTRLTITKVLPAKLDVTNDFLDETVGHLHDISRGIIGNVGLRLKMIHDHLTQTNTEVVGLTKQDMKFNQKKHEEMISLAKRSTDQILESMIDLKSAIFSALPAIGSFIQKGIGLFFKAKFILGIGAAIGMSLQKTMHNTFFTATTEHIKSLTMAMGRTLGTISKSFWQHTLQPIVDEYKPVVGKFFDELLNELKMRMLVAGSTITSHLIMAFGAAWAIRRTAELMKDKTNRQKVMDFLNPFSLTDDQKKILEKEKHQSWQKMKFGVTNLFKRIADPVQQAGQMISKCIDEPYRKFRRSLVEKKFFDLGEREEGMRAAGLWTEKHDKQLQELSNRYEYFGKTFIERLTQTVSEKWDKLLHSENDIGSGIRTVIAKINKYHDVIVHKWQEAVNSRTFGGRILRSVSRIGRIVGSGLQRAYRAATNSAPMLASAAGFVGKFVLGVAALPLRFLNIATLAVTIAIAIKGMVSAFITRGMSDPDSIRKMKSKGSNFVTDFIMLTLKKVGESVLNIIAWTLKNGTTILKGIASAWWKATKYAMAAAIGTILSVVPTIRDKVMGWIGLKEEWNGIHNAYKKASSSAQSIDEQAKAAAGDKEKLAEEEKIKKDELKTAKENAEAANQQVSLLQSLVDFMNPKKIYQGVGATFGNIVNVFSGLLGDQAGASLKNDMTAFGQRQAATGGDLSKSLWTSMVDTMAEQDKKTDEHYNTVEDKLDKIIDQQKKAAENSGVQNAGALANIAAGKNITVPVSVASQYSPEEFAKNRKQIELKYAYATPLGQFPGEIQKSVMDLITDSGNAESVIKDSQSVLKLQNLATNILKPYNNSPQRVQYAYGQLVQYAQSKGGAPSLLKNWGEAAAFVKDKINTAPAAAFRPAGSPAPQPITLGRNGGYSPIALDTGDPTSVNPNSPKPAPASGGEILNKVKRMIQNHEGWRDKVYRCTAGHLTIGYGHKLLPNEMGLTQITQAQGNALFDNDFRIAQGHAAKLPYFAKLDAARQGAIIDMIFNMGYGGLLKFKNMNAALNAGDYNRAAAEIMNSAYARQTGQRAPKIARIIQTGQIQGVSGGPLPVAGPGGGGGGSAGWSGATKVTDADIAANLGGDTSKVKQLHPVLLERLVNYAKMVKGRIPGGKVHVTSSFRSNAEQARLFAEKGPGWAARPGTSKHNFGLAVDMNRTSVLSNELAQAGLARPMAREPWHVEASEWSSKRLQAAIAQSKTMAPGAAFNTGDVGLMGGGPNGNGSMPPGMNPAEQTGGGVGLVDRIKNLLLGMSGGGVTNINNTAVPPGAANMGDAVTDEEMFKMIAPAILGAAMNGNTEKAIHTQTGALTNALTQNAGNVTIIHAPSNVNTSSTNVNAPTVTTNTQTQGRELKGSGPMDMGLRALLG